MGSQTGDNLGAMVQIFVTCGSKTSAVDVTHKTTTGDVASLVGASENAIFMNGLECLESFAHLAEESLVHAFDPLVGGGKKKKKKKQLANRKKPHVKRKVKLHVLKLYRVDTHGRVQRLRKMCPGTMCGPGVFMATHEDRTYCGRCYMTYISKDTEAK